jgi:dienelactone hydrolase
MTFQRMARFVGILWRPARWVGRVTGRGLVTFFGAGWPGLTLGLVAMALGFFGLMGAHLHTGLWRPLDGLLGVLVASVGLGLTALVLLLLRLMFRAWPARSLIWGLGAFLLVMGFFLSMGASSAGLWSGVVLSALPGGIGLGLAVALRRGLHGAWRTTGALLVLASVLGSFALVRWLHDPGTDPYLGGQAMAAGPAVAPLDLPDPSGPGPFAVKTLTYGSGNDRRRPEFASGASLRTQSVNASPFLINFKGFSARMRKWYWGFGKEAFPVNGRVWYPVGPGPFPLVLCVHGNHTAQTFSDPGYAYLGERMASRGFIFVSVDENFVNGSWEGGIDKESAVRGWMLLKHLEVWRAWNGEAGHLFEGKVDLDRISLIGHSRGGEAVIIAAAYNRLPCWPEDATQPFAFGFGIRSVVAIAPIDGQYETSGVATPVRNVDYLVLQGSHDSDVATFAGQRTLHRVAFTDGKPHFKAGLYFHRANHGQFNTVWGSRDIGEPFSSLLATGALMPAEDQRRIALVTIGAFLETTLKDQRGYRAFFQDPRAGAAWLPRTILLNQYQDETFRPVATFEEDLDPTTTTLEGGRIQGEHLTIWKEMRVKGRGDWDFRQKGTWLGWERTKEQEAIASYTVTLPSTFAPEARLDSGSRLVLDLADTDEKPHVDKEEDADKKDAKKPEEGKEDETRRKDPVDFTVELVDGEGRSAALPLSALRPLQPVLKVRHSKWKTLEDVAYPKAWEPVFQTFELPLSAFRKVTPAFMPGELRTIRLRFDKSPKGVVILEKVGFSHAPE